MATDDRKYQVFVSSTYKDLQEERQEIMHALLELDCTLGHGVISSCK